MSDIIKFRRKENEAARAVLERCARDQEALVARITDGPVANFRIMAPKDIGTPTVEIRHTYIECPIRITPDQADAIGHALIEAAKRWRE
jgi:hypothetical protein